MKTTGSLDLSKIDPKSLYTLSQIGDLLNLSYATVLKLKKNSAFGELEPIDGKKFLVQGQAILDYVSKKLGGVR